MHQCLKCGRIITDVAQIEEGCECGSQVFVFIKSDLHAKQKQPKSTLSLMDFEKNESAEKPPALPSQKESQAPTAQQIPVSPSESLLSSPVAQVGEKMQIRPDSVASSAKEDFADEKWDEIWLAKGGSISAASDFDLENIRQVKKGVYEVDVTALADQDPLVVKDERGIYYVRLPFTEVKLPSGNGKKG